MSAESFVAFTSGLLLGVGGLKLKGKLSARSQAKRAKKAAAAAREQALQRAEAAEALLKSRGYTIVARDAPASYALVVDGDPQVVHVSADFLVEGEGKRMIAEVKVGAAAKLDTAATRWQLLEQQHAFGVRSVVLINPDAKELSTLRFPLPKASLVAVATPPKPTREASALAQKTAKDKTRAVRRRKFYRYLALAAAIGTVWWVLRDKQPSATSQPPDAASAAPDEARRARPRSSRVVTK